jgi:hypothetical protein
VVSSTSLPLYPQGNSPWYLLDRRLGGPQNRSGHGGEERMTHKPTRKGAGRFYLVTPIVLAIWRSMNRWEDNFKTDREIGYYGVYCIHVT